MDGRGTSDRLREIEAALASIEHRLSVLERADGVPARFVLDPPSAVIPSNALFRPGDFAALLGRASLVFGGAYLLRALTQSGRLPAGAGLALGLIYALVWLVAADRTAARKRTSAAFHGLTAILLALPVIWEGATRFDLVSAPAAALLLGGFAGSALIVAHRRKLPVLAGAAAFGTAGGGVALALATGHHTSFAFLLIALSTATYWYSERPEHAWLRWPVAITAGLFAMAMTGKANSVAGYLPQAFTLQTALIAAMEGSLAVRLVLLSRRARVFDIAQGFSALVIGVGGAALLAYGSGSGLALIGVAAAILAAGAYLAAFFRLADRPHLSVNYHAFAAFGLAAGTIAVVLMFSGHPLAIAALALAIATLAFGQPRLGEYAALHASVFLVTSVLASDLLTSALAVWVSRPEPWPAMDFVAWVTLGAAMACVLLPVRPRSGLGGMLTLAGRIVMATVVVIGAGGAVLMLVAPIAGSDAGALASVRTGLLSISVVLLTIAGRTQRLAIFSTLVYPALIVGGLRILADDLRHSRPSTLFVALAFYGLALVSAGRARTAASRSARAGD